MTNLSRNHIQNLDNYKNTFDDSVSTIITKYELIINEYLKHGKDNIYIQNLQYFKYVLRRGINTLNHVFKLLLIYTKNLEIVYYNCQKSYIYYIEFIGQIGDDNHSFLQLNSKDASLFVYKKSIFDINSDIRNNYVLDNQTNKIINDVDKLIKIYNILLNIIIEGNEISGIIKIVNTDLHNSMNKLIKFYVDGEENKNPYNDERFVCITLFCSHCKKTNILEALELFIKKLKKTTNIDICKLEKILINQDSIIDLSLIKYINYIINNIIQEDLVYHQKALKS